MAFVSVLIMTFLYVIDLYAKETNPYLGILLYMIVPPFLILGLLLIPLGMYRTWKKIKVSGDIEYPRWPYIDLNQKSHRNATFIFILGTAVFVIVGAVGSYQGYHYTDSVTFCGRTCHSVMKPEYTAYQNSPHARVACVECHVGPGADWFARSKLSGLYQVYATLADKYPRPIPTPIENLRPARETCEQCHWPEKFFGAQQRQFDHYTYDSANTHWPINMLIKTGGGDPSTGRASGIHWHMYIGNKIEYIARDERRLDIPWVKATDLQTGEVTIYRNTDDPPDKEIIQQSIPRVLDCMDCHNRPSHIYHPPDHAADDMIATGKIDTTLPYIKKVAVEAMSEEYETEEKALAGIADNIMRYYESAYPAVTKNESDKLGRATKAAQGAFTGNVFPEMNVSWEKYPDHRGHFYSVGCMRCHGGNHTSDDGKTVVSDCHTCHLILSQGSGERATVSFTQEGLEFEHPEDIFEAWRDMGCYECHTGTQP